MSMDQIWVATCHTAIYNGILKNENQEIAKIKTKGSADSIRRFVMLMTS